MVIKCVVHMYITAELKAYWLLVKSLTLLFGKLFLKIPHMTQNVINL